MNSTIHRANSDKFVSIETTNVAIQKNQLKIVHKLERKRSKGNVDIPGRGWTNNDLDGMRPISIYGELTRQRLVWLAYHHTHEK
ncbi:hypothetical protein GQ55_1G101900 [Panicum hallii var. hallii]|jgi:hypothetical protein|uniref:Uncharacterized protein n=1 Tax=Panicum hallii var. hallii TaxID=1504633 RepID=A0A2T7F472_9POAL|nr:hypothetical protein GQ55_1G101900 [Panicum hallii var. hallii]